MRCALFHKELPTFETIRIFGARFPQFEFSAIEAFITMAGLFESTSQAMDAHFARHELSRGRFFILMLLLRTPDGTSPANLSKSCGISRATVTGLLDTLEAADLIVREPTPEDRRALNIRITDKGRHKMDAMLPDHYQRISGLMRGLNEDERALFVRFLGKVADGLPSLKNP